MFKWKSARNGPQHRTKRRSRLETWAVAVAFLVLITVTVSQALSFVY
jgi:hypothetical protein